MRRPGVGVARRVGFRGIGGESLKAPAAPTISGAPSIGATCTITPNAAGGVPTSFAEYLDGIASGRTVAANGRNAVTYVYVAGDVGGTFLGTGSVTFVAINAAGTSAPSNALAYAPTQFSGLLYLIDNATGQDGAYASIVDRSPGARALTVSASAPVGFPRNWEEGAKPLIGFNSGLTQTAKDLGAGAAAYAGAMHLAGTGFIFRGELRDTNANGQVFGTHSGSSNGNSFAMFWDGTTIHVYVTSTTLGGTVHIDASTAAIRPGDAFTCTFLHQTDKTWTCKFVREARAPGDTQTTTNLNGSYSSTIAAGDAPAGLTIGNLTGLAGNPKGSRIHTLACFNIGGSTASDVADMEAYLAKCNFSFVSFTSTGAPAYPADFADTTHWDDSGHATVAAAGIIAEQAVATALGWTTQKNEGVIGDSRFMGSGASVLGTTDFRALLAAGPYSGGFSHLGYGPIDDGSGNAASKKHFARSGYVTRSIASSAQLGHSQRSSHSASIDVFVNAATGTHRSVDLWHVMIGINELVGTTATAVSTWDFVDELVRMLVYIAQQRVAFDGVTPAFILYTEPVTGSTTTGLAQRLIRARNRAYHAAVTYLRSLGYTVLLVECNDESYNA